MIWLALSTWLMATALAGDTKQVGSARELTGCTHFVIVFVSDADSEWSLIEQWKMKRLIKGAERWIKVQHRVHRQQEPRPRFSHSTIGRWRDIHFERMPAGTRSGTEAIDLVQKVSQQLGYPSTENWQRQYNSDQFAVLILMKRDGASYAIPQEHGLNSQFDVEGAVLYQAFDADTPNCATCIAHEILHLFGAWDLYRTFQTTVEQERLAQKLYPNSIMLRTSYNPYELTMDPVTCWRIGWCTKPTHAHVFEPKPQ